MERKQLTDTLMIALDQALANLHTMTVARVTSVGIKTINVQPVINRVVEGESIKLPEFVDVPPVFLGGGASALTMPVAVGDYALMMFTERCFDRWWAGQDEQRPLELRMHDYSDGFALVGLKPETSAWDIPSVMTLIGDLTHQGALTVTGDVSAGNGVTGVFLSQDGKTVTVTDGIVVSII